MIPGLGGGVGLMGAAESIPAPTVPSAFTAGQWSIVTWAAGQASGTISTTPADGGSPIIRYEYWNGSTWTSIGLALSFIVSGTPGAVVNVQIRAVNAIGNGPASDVKAVTLGASVPAAFSDGQWSLNTGAAGQADGSISSYPANNGSALTSLQWEVGASGVWNTFAVTTSFTVTGPAGTVVGVRIRAVNAVGAGPASNSKNILLGSDGGGGGGK